MSEDAKPRVRVEIVGDPSRALALSQEVVGTTRLGLLGEEFANALGSQIAEANKQVFAAFAESLKPKIDVASIIGEGFNTQVAEMMDALKPTFERFQEMWETALPPNWREFEKLDRVNEILAFMEETGWSLAWVPRPEVIEGLLAAAGENARAAALLDREGEVLDDLTACLSEVADLKLAEVKEIAAEAVDSYRGGRRRAAQALATCLFTTLIHVHLEQRTLGGARATFARHDPMHVSIGRFRLVAILRSAGRAIEQFRGEPNEPIPTTFNRHASTHRVGVIQYTRLNALTSLMLVVSLARELEFWAGRELITLP